MICCLPARAVKSSLQKESLMLLTLQRSTCLHLLNQCRVVYQYLFVCNRGEKVEAKAIPHSELNTVKRYCSHDVKMAFYLSIFVSSKHTNKM